MPDLPRGLGLLSAINEEMEFVLRLKRLSQERPPETAAPPRPVSRPKEKPAKNYGPG